MSHELWFRSPAHDWFEALPIGNGHLGGKVFGRVGDERIALNLDDVWSGDGPRTLQVTDGPAVLADVRRLLLEEGDQLAATERTRALQGPLVESYQPLGDLLITSAGDDVTQHGVTQYGVTQYRRSLDLRTGVVAVEYTRGEVRFRRETFVSTPDQVLVWTITADSPGSVDLTVGLASQHPAQTPVVDSNTIGLVGRAPADLTIEYRTSPDPIRYDDQRGTGFGVAVRAFPVGGTIATGVHGMSVTGADAVTLVLSAASTFQGWSVRPGRGLALGEAVRILDAAAQFLPHPTAPVAVDKLRARHIEDHVSLYDRAELTLGTAVDLRPTSGSARSVLGATIPTWPDWSSGSAGTC